MPLVTIFFHLEEVGLGKCVIALIGRSQIS